MRYVFDTNAVIALVGKTSTPLVQRVRTTPFGDIVLSSIVVHELAFGAYRSAKAAFNLSKLQTLTREMAVVDYTFRDACAAGEIRADLARAGTPIGPYDVLLAGHARSRDLCLVTNNTREFRRIDGLRLEDWTV